MSSLDSTNDPLLAKGLLEKLQHDTNVALGLTASKCDDEITQEWAEKYLRSNPDYSPEQCKEHAARMRDFQVHSDRSNIACLGSSTGTLKILCSRVDELKLSCARLKRPRVIKSICFGTVSGGGLDAYAFKVPGVDEYGIVIPAGMFDLINLTCKLIVLMQPIVMTDQGAIYSPRANFDQLLLFDNPYVQFRRLDLMRAYFLSGDPQVALPYLTAPAFQDRFAYLLVGTELFILAHEAAHVMLGHLISDGRMEYSPTIELEADALAYEVVTQFFKQSYNFPEARATLCATMFLSLNRLWEETVRGMVKDNDFLIHSHPTHDQRFDHLSSLVGSLPQKNTPPWYMFVHNAIGMATKLLSDAERAKIFSNEPTSQYLSARVLPLQFAHLGNVRTFDQDRWSSTIANLLIEGSTESRRLGLWFLTQSSFEVVKQFYQGLLGDDEDVKQLYTKALISIEPMYQAYLPRLMERFRETEIEEQRDEYIINLGAYLSASASAELGPERSVMDPLNPTFFGSLPERQAEEESTKFMEKGTKSSHLLGRFFSFIRHWRNPN